MADYEAVTGPSAIARSPVEFDDTPVPVEQPIGNPMLQGRSMMARTALDLTPSVQDGPSPVQSMMPLPDAPPAHMIAAVQMDPVTGMPTPTPGARILQMPTIAQSTMPEYIYKVDPNSAEMRPWLPDMTGNSIDLSGNRNMASRQLIAVERYPTLPFWPGTYNRRAIQRQMSDIELFIRSWKPKQIPPFALTSSASWQQMPHPAPVFVLIPHFGTSVALYYRWGNAISRPILYYAVRQLTPMPRMANNEYVGPIWEVFASWCKPLKWAAGRVIPPDMINPTGAVKIMTDKGIEFQIDYDTFRNSQDPRLVVAKNALRRDMPELDASLAMRSNAPPPEILREMAQTATWRSGTSSLMEGTGILTSTGRIVPKPEPRTAADAAEEAGDADETPAATSKPAARPAPAVTAARAPIGGNNAMVRSAVLQDSFPSVAY